MDAIDMETWPRKNHFLFFQGKKNPCWGLTVPVDVKNLLAYRTSLGLLRPRFTDCLYHALTKSANAVPEFRMRLVDRCPVLFDQVDAAFTYTPSGAALHAHCVAGFDRDFSTFVEKIQRAREKADASPTLAPEGGESQGLIYLTCLPDIAFTAFTNPWDDPWTDSVPRLTFGKVDAASGLMPLSFEVLHSFVDGMHVAAFLRTFNEIVEEPSRSFPVEA